MVIVQQADVAPVGSPRPQAVSRQGPLFGDCQLHVTLLNVDYFHDLFLIYL